jgi:hypothetical protein
VAIKQLITDILLIVVLNTTILNPFLFHLCMQSLVKIFLLHLGLVFASDKGSVTIRVVVFVDEGLGCIFMWVIIRLNIGI